MKNRLLTVAIGAGLLLAIVGLHYRIPALVALTLATVRAVVFVSGTRMIVTRRADIVVSENVDAPKEHYTGVAAQLWGLLYIMLSALPGAFAVGVALYGQRAPPAGVVATVLASPVISGALIIAGGAAFVLYGLTRLVQGNAPFADTRLRPGARVAGGVSSCTIGAVIVTVGLVHALAPGALTALRDGVIGWLLARAK